MTSLTVGQVKTHFSEVLSKVKNGEKIRILYGKSRKPVAMLVPIEDLNKTRKIGILNGKASFYIEGYGKITEQEFLGK